MREGLEFPAEVLACPPESFAQVAYVKLVASRFAAYMAAHYNGCVYLVGSSLRVARPRDIDVRIVVSDKEFCGRYSYKDDSDWVKRGPNQAWIDDVAKYNGELAEHHRLNGDFQVYCASGCIQYRDKPRILLAAPTKLDHIAESTAWWDGEDGG